MAGSHGFVAGKTHRRLCACISTTLNCNVWVNPSCDKWELNKGIKHHSTTGTHTIDWCNRRQSMQFNRFLLTYVISIYHATIRSLIALWYTLGSVLCVRWKLRRCGSKLIVVGPSYHAKQASASCLHFLSHTSKRSKCDSMSSSSEDQPFKAFYEEPKM